MAESLGDLGDPLGEIRRVLAGLAGLEVGGQRLAAELDHAGNVPGQPLDIQGLQLEGIIARYRRRACLALRRLGVRWFGVRRLRRGDLGDRRVHHHRRGMRGAGLGASGGCGPRPAGRRAARGQGPWACWRVRAWPTPPPAGSAVCRHGLGRRRLLGGALLPPPSPRPWRPADWRPWRRALGVDLDTDLAWVLAVDVTEGLAEVFAGVFGRLRRSSLGLWCGDRLGGAVTAILAGLLAERLATGFGASAAFAAAFFSSTFGSFAAAFPLLVRALAGLRGGRLVRIASRHDRLSDPRRFAVTKSVHFLMRAY